MLPHSHPRRRNNPALRNGKSRPYITWILLGCASIVALGWLLMQTLTNSSGQAQWLQGETYGHWHVRYTGYGQVTSDNARITLEPQSAASHDVTHGGLVHTTGQCHQPSFSLTLNTESQVRTGDPNTWEVGWVLWNFQSDTHFYAVALKPNGWEISKQDPHYPGNQRFLETGDTPKFPTGHDYTVSVTQHDGRMTVTADGTELATVVDDETPYRDGSIALYTEDARVHFFDFDLPDCALAQ